MRWTAAVGALAAAQQVASQQIYFDPPVTKGKGDGGALTASRAAALLSHVFGTSQHTATGSSNYADLLPAPPHDGQQLVIMIDCPANQDCASALPKKTTTTTTTTTMTSEAFTLPNLPFASWASLVTLEVSRMAQEYGIDPSQITGLDSLVQSIKQVPGWVHWITKELGQFIGWDDIVTDTRQREPQQHQILTDVDFLDDLVFDLEQITQLAEKAQEGDNKAAPAQVHVLHLKGLKDLSAKSWDQGTEMLSKSLEALLASVKPVQLTVLSLPPYRKPLLSKRTPFLDPFRSPIQERYFRAKRDVPDNHLANKRQSLLAPPSGNDDQKEKDKKKTKVVPHAHMCFKDAKDVKNQTANCMSHGEPVEAVSNYQDGACWVCACEKGYGGQGCEKRDVSSGFMLLFLSSAGLILILVASVMLLFGSANEPLPSTLAAVSGAK